jgi:glycosyltransferase involved in cell wall biosynthesis
MYTYMRCLQTKLALLLPMRIGFDAKRIFENTTGLGNYSRTLVSTLAVQHPTDNLFLYAPKTSHLFNAATYNNIQTVVPTTYLHKNFKGLWRSSWVKKNIQAQQIQIYHGLSHEIPVGMQNTATKSVVTIHDLIFERYPNQFSFFDTKIYHHKFLNACTHANKIIAISQQTKQDIISYYNIAANKIEVCYQSCHAAFFNGGSHATNLAIGLQFKLPPNYFITVGSIIERKNLLLICQAYKNDTTLPPLVVIGTGDGYEKKVRSYIHANGIANKFIFLNDTVKKISNYQLAALYQNSIALIYPSIFEGFGIPILEAMASKCPVITSNVSCMPEAGGNAALYINPFEVNNLLHQMHAVLHKNFDRNLCIQKGLDQANKFNATDCANAVYNVYKTLV